VQVFPPQSSSPLTLFRSMASGARLLSVLVLYPCGSGNAAIIPSILPNRLRLKCPSASEMPVSFNLPDCRLRQPTISTSEEEAAGLFCSLDSGLGNLLCETAAAVRRKRAIGNVFTSES